MRFPLYPLISHTSSHTAYAFLVDFGFGSTAALFFFTLKDNPPHGASPLVFSLSLSAFSFFFSTASVPSGHHWRFGVFLPLQRCSRARSSSLLCSALLPLLFPNQQCSNQLTHLPSGGAKRRVVQRLVATSAVLCFVLFCFRIGTLFLSHRFLLTGLIPARGMGWLWVPLDGYFLCFWIVGAFWGVCSEAVRAGSV